MPVAVVTQRKSRGADDVRSEWLRLHGASERRAVGSLRRRFFAPVARAVLGRFDLLATDEELPGVDMIFRPGDHRRAFWLSIGTRWQEAIESGMELEKAWTSGNSSDESQSIDDIMRFVEKLPEVIRASIATWLQDREVGVWARVTQTIRRRLARRITEGLDEGVSLVEMRARIQGTLRGATKHQAVRIARTEMTAAMNTGQDRQRVVDSIAEKQWISTIDNATRAGAFDHVTPDGQVVDQPATFSVSGERLLYPGDIAHGASAGNVINCRCVSISHF